MENDIDPFSGNLQGRWVEEVANGILERQTLQADSGAGGPDQGTDLVSLTYECSGEVGAEESRGAGDEYLHVREGVLTQPLDDRGLALADSNAERSQAVVWARLRWGASFHFMQ